MLNAILLILLGFVALVVGADGLVRGAASLALRLGVSALVVGLTIVACGTSAPELAVSVYAAISGNPDIALANVVGSNSFNIGGILGLTALIAPIACATAIVKRETPIMIGVALLVPACAFLTLAQFDQHLIARWQGALLLVLAILYTFFLYRNSRRESPQAHQQFEAGVPAGESADTARKRPVLLDLAYILGGVLLLILGSRFLVSGATTIAKALGVSDVIIGLTIVACGTSLPELATSLIAAIKKQPDLSVGNIVGSNIFNVLLILGAASTISPIHVDNAILYRDVPVMLAFSVALLPMMRTGFRLSRLEGALLLFGYAAYVTWLVIDASRAPLPAS